MLQRFHHRPNFPGELLLSETVTLKACKYLPEREHGLSREIDEADGHEHRVQIELEVGFLTPPGKRHAPVIGPAKRKKIKGLSRHTRGQGEGDRILETDNFNGFFFQRIPFLRKQRGVLFYR